MAVSAVPLLTALLQRHLVVLAISSLLIVGHLFSITNEHNDLNLSVIVDNVATWVLVA